MKRAVVRVSKKRLVEGLKLKFDIRLEAIVQDVNDIIANTYSLVVSGDALPDNARVIAGNEALRLYPEDIFAREGD